MDGLQPAIDIGGNNNGGWGNWGGALIGGAIGAAFGSGWNNNNGRNSYAQRLTEQEGCAARQAIHSEGEAARGLLAQLGRGRLLGELADAKASLAACQQRQFAESLSLQARNNIIQHVRAFIPAAAAPAAAG